MMKTAQERYRHDPAFKALVDQMVAHIENSHYTPSEMRDAAMTASIIYEQKRPPTMFVPDFLDQEYKRLMEQYPEFAKLERAVAQQREKNDV